MKPGIGGVGAQLPESRELGLKSSSTNQLGHPRTVLLAPCALST